MTEAKEIKITRDQLSTVCWAFHKWFRVADCKGDAEMWNAIHNLEDASYTLAMEDSLKEIGIKVTQND